MRKFVSIVPGRFILASIISSAMAFNGYKKRSLNKSGCAAAVIVGFIALSASYRFGVILILFYYSSSTLTKYKSQEKVKIEEDHAVGGNRNYLQVFANSILATMVALVYYWVCGEDENVNFSSSLSSSSDVHIELLFVSNISKELFGSLCWSMYVAHYATANGDTWASELGVLSKSKPRLVTSLFFAEVPPGTNGGMSLLGTSASVMGGGFIGLVFWSMSFFDYSQFPMVIAGFCYGFIGSLIDSILGATIQASYYNIEKKYITKSRYRASGEVDTNVMLVSGIDFVSNEFVNFLSILITMLISLWLTPVIFCYINSTHC
jgi:uncharacterized membrane protein